MSQIASLPVFYHLLVVMPHRKVVCPQGTLAAPLPGGLVDQEPSVRGTRKVAAPTLNSKIHIHLKYRDPRLSEY